MWLKSLLKRMLSIPKIFSASSISRYKRFQHLVFFLSFYKDLNEWKPDIVQCHDWQTLSLGCQIKKEFNSRLIFDSHELETHRNPPLTPRFKRWLKKYERRYLQKCDIVTAVSPSIARFLEVEYNLDEVLFLPNTPLVRADGSFERWGPSNPDCNIRSEAQLKKSDFVAVIVGNITVNRGVENAIEAMAALPLRVKLVLLGKSNLNIKNDLIKLAELNGVQDRVFFLDPVSPLVVVNFLKSADISIIPILPNTLSYELAMPNKFFESVYAGLPIVSSDLFDLTKIIDDYQLGEVYPAGDVVELVQRVKKLYTKWDRGNPMKIDNFKFKQDFDFQSHFKKIIRKIEVL
jgi:glycogen synthase